MVCDVDLVGIEDESMHERSINLSCRELYSPQTVPLGLVLSAIFPSSRS